jgi:SAM-dependent methyltransferase
LAGEADSSAKDRCPVCASREARVCLEVPRAPVVVGGLWKSREEARACPQGRIELAVCRRCSAVWNRAFDPKLLDYGAGYDNALHHSPVFRKFERELAERLVARYALRGRDVIEIGSGSGHFLALLCELAEARGVGFDPSHEPEHADPRLGARARVVRGYYGPEHAALPVDALVCRQVLEHVDEPHAFLAGLRELLAKHGGGIGYFEVPNALLSLRDLSVWNLIYEHPVYYTTTSLAHLFRRCGFEVLDAREAYEGQFVSADVRPGAPDDAPPPPAEVEAVLGYAEGFRRHCEELTAGWRSRLAELAAAGERAVLWGAGAKGVSFTNLLGIGDAIELAVDVNPRKQGTFLAGSGQRIVAPEALVEYRPGLVVVMNPIYEDEIRAQLRRLGVPARVESL